MGRSRAGLRMCICGWRRIFEGPCENHKIPTKIAPITTSQADLQKNTQQIRLFCRKHKRGMRGACLAYVFDNSPVAEVSGRLDEIGGEEPAFGGETHARREEKTGEEEACEAYEK